MPKAKASKNKDEKPNIEQEIKKLVKTAKKDGFVNQKTIFELLPEVPENADALDALYTELAV
jgi:hypothetical protein